MKAKAANEPATWLYQISNPEYGKYLVWRRKVGDPEGAWAMLQTKPFDTFAEARAFIRNRAVRDRNERDFAPGKWTFTETQAVNSTERQPARMDG